MRAVVKVCILPAAGAAVGIIGYAVHKTHVVAVAWVAARSMGDAAPLCVVQSFINRFAFQLALVHTVVRLSIGAYSRVLGVCQHTVCIDGNITVVIRIVRIAVLHAVQTQLELCSVGESAPVVITTGIPEPV